MRNRMLSLALIATFALPALVAGAAPAADSWIGEIVEKGCFVSRGAHGPDHADCAKRCLERGGDMGLLTDDGDLLILKPSAEDAAPFEALKGLAGAKAKVTGEATEDEDGMTVVTVTASEAVS